MKKVLLPFILIGFSIIAFSQQSPSNTIGNNVIEPTYRLVNITGTITDSLGMPLFGVNVIIKGTKTGTQTDSKGQYSIKAKKGDVLVFSFVGMHTQELTLEDIAVVDIVLRQNTETLKEVVVNAEKISIKEKAKSYSSSLITSDKLIKGGFTDIDQALQVHGRNWRGGAPLLIYDGMPLDFQDRNIINFYEISTIEVIRSASATLRYGPRATEGVIIITSKANNNFIEANNNYKARLKASKYQGIIKVKESFLEEPYIEELSIANSAEEAYNLYLKQKNQYGHLPTYYLNVYNYFKKWNNKEYELKILFNDVITDLHNPEQLKALAYLLESAKEYKLAINIYTQVLKLLPDDLQSYRDLALVYKNIGLVNESSAILKSLTVDGSNSNKSILQFQNINDILKNDMGHLSNEKVEATYDVRIVADWNRYDTNINLHVIDPTREICYYENPVTRQGGQLAQNMSQGGPEEFTLKNAKKGSYFVMVNYSLKDDSEITAMPTYIKLTMYKYYGKPNETKEIKIIRLAKPNDKEIVAKMEI
ncbi:carboxypeptidase-like regulatory domain-containing protein [Confluentibacter citreus]|uniref:carboxypeptidase-like regulatory domain-containing protein n=1 Tax=Confluentibacter citreus TaxID=2007307 RepID=UPI000C2870F5|nr:carboxypeptidase-like regulatory domain-containing protein [Confluentibacter citreus]